MTAVSEGVSYEKPARRVGTFTLGVTLLAVGMLLAAAQFWPALDLNWALKASPLILISLGVETLLAARGSGRIKYDWVGMLLCFLLIGAAMSMYAASWWLSWWPEHGSYFQGSRSGDESSLRLDYSAFNGTEFQVLELEAGDMIVAEIVSDRGSVDVSVVDDADREPIFDQDDLGSGTYAIEVPESGSYEIRVTGNQAAGSACFQRDPQE